MINCKKAQKLIPDLRIGELSGRLRDEVKNHLTGCDKCRSWSAGWEMLCASALENMTPPKDLNWTPFDEALEAEFRRRGRQSAKLTEFWQYLTGGLWLFPKRSQLRALFTGAAAGFVIFMGSHFAPIKGTGHSHLTIGGFISSEEQDGVMIYRYQDAGPLHYQEIVKPDEPTSENPASADEKTEQGSHKRR